MSKPFTYIYNESLSQGIVPNILKISKVTPVFKSDLTTDPSNYRHQFGFRKNHSTELAILEISDNLKNSIDNKLIICGLFLDFSKALTQSTMIYCYGNYTDMEYVAWLWIGLDIICPIWHSGQSLFWAFFFQGSKLESPKG